MAKVKCLSCNTILESTWVHDFQMCDCGNKTFVDGGDEYVRVGGLDLSLIEMIYIDEKPLPCPFCGSHVELFQRENFGSDYDHSKDTDNWDISCTNVDCYLSDGADWWLEEKDVIKLWNRRGICT